MALMIFVDDAGEANPWITHSAWNSVTIADFVMPAFLFMVGTSQAFSFSKFKTTRDARWRGTVASIVRALKLYGLGVLLQGGGFIGSSAMGPYTFGFNLSTLRVCGILNRIAFAYLFAALIELWLTGSCFASAKPQSNTGRARDAEGQLEASLLGNLGNDDEERQQVSTLSDSMEGRSSQVSGLHRRGRISLLNPYS